MNTDISSFESFICFCNVSWVSVQWSTLRGKKGWRYPWLGSGERAVSLQSFSGFVCGAAVLLNLLTWPACFLFHHVICFIFLDT